MSIKFKELETFKLPCYVANSFEECAGYIKNIHTTDTGALKWDTASIKRFEDKMGRKNIFSQLQKYCPKAFEGLRSDFSVNKFERIASSKVGRKYLDISFNNNILMPLSSIEELEKKVSKLVQDIVNGEITGNVVKNNENIEKYLNGELKSKTNDIISNSEIKQLEIIDNNSEKQNVEERRTINKIKLTRKDNNILFKNINCSKLKYNNERAKGIKNLSYEIQHLSFGNLYKTYPISYCFLVPHLNTFLYFHNYKNIVLKHLKD